MSINLYNMPDNNSKENKVKHEKTKKVIKIVGPIILVLGIISLIVGIVISFQGEMSFIWLPIVSMVAIFIGSTLTIFGYRREMARYAKNESVPVINEASEDFKPTFKNIAEAFKDDSSSNHRCPYCGHDVDENSKFCSNCGKQLTVICPHCHQEVDPGKFCSNCGKPLQEDENK